MSEKKKVDRKAKILVYGIFAIIVAIVAIAYIFIFKDGIGNNLIVKYGDLEFEMIEKDRIDLSDMVPVSDSDGNKVDPYKFNVKNNSDDEKLYYKISLFSNNTENGISYFNNENIKFSLKKNDKYVIGDENTGLSLENFEGFIPLESEGSSYILENQSVDVGEVNDYELRIWLSDSVIYASESDGSGIYDDFKYSLQVSITPVDPENI